MKRFSISFFVFLFYMAGAFSQQNKKIDSLNTVASSSLPDTSRVKALCELVKEYSGTDNDKALSIAFAAKKLAEGSGNKKFIAYSLNGVGTAFDFKSMADSAMKYYLSSLKIFEELKDKSGMAASYQNIGVLYYFQTDLEKALSYYKKALDLRMQTKEFNYVAKLYNNMGVIFRRQKKYDEALDIYRESFKLKTKLNDTKGISACYLNIGTVFRYTGQYDSALKYINSSLAMDSLFGSEQDLASSFVTRGDLYLSMKKIPEAKSDLQTGINICRKINAPDLMYNAYADMVEADTLLGDFRAALNDLYYFIQYKDAVINKEKAKQLEKLQALYESEKKDSEIKMLNADNANKKKEQKTLYIIVSLVVLLLFISLFFYFRKQKDNLLLKKQKQEILAKTEQLQEQAAQIAKLQTQMNPHFMFNALNSIQQFIVGKNMSQSLAYLNDFSRLMRLTLNNSEKELIPIKDEISFLKLYVTFEELRFENKFEFVLTVDPSLDTDSILIPPMLVQPFLENAVKHGLLPKKEKGKLEVVFSSKEKRSLEITIRDNGIGRAASAKLKEGKKLLHESKGMMITEKRILSFCQKNNFPIVRPLEITDMNINDLSGTKIKLTLPFVEEFG